MVATSPLRKTSQVSDFMCVRSISIEQRCELTRARAQLKREAQRHGFEAPTMLCRNIDCMD